MEFIINNKAVLDNLPSLHPNGVGISSSELPFIEANTIEMSIQEMKDKHIIPVWTASNEPLISHNEFIETIWHSVNGWYKGETILKPNVRVSHPIKGRIPEAKHKLAKDLEPWEQTIYYERMMFVIEIPSIYEIIDGNKLSLMIGGVKSFGEDNPYGKRASGNQHFQIFIGFQNKICCNMCVWTDGLHKLATVRELKHIRDKAEEMFYTFNASKNLNSLKSLINVSLTEKEFAQVVGRARMYKYLDEETKKDILPLLLGDQQMSSVVGKYYGDENFGNSLGGEISLWHFYNLLTGANKSTYIDSFLDRGVNALAFSNEILKQKQGKKDYWYLS